MLISNSPDITLLDFQVTWDITGKNPVISVVNLSEGSGLANLTWWFEVYSPTNSPIHKGSASSVDATGVWTTKTLSDPWPKPNYAIEWSGAPYSITLFAKDSNGQVYSVNKTVAICRPDGNTDGSKNTFGKANIYLKVIYDKARILFEDRTKSTYKGIEGTRISSLLTMSYPIDDTGFPSAPFQLANFSTAMVPISYSSDGYAFAAFSIYEYDFGNHVKVRIKWFQQESFPVLGDVDLSALFCEIQKLSEDVEYGRCENQQASLKNLTIINSKFMLAVTGKMEPLSGIDVPKLVDEIKSIGGFTCNCCSVSSGIVAQSAGVVDNFSFDVNPTGGDIQGTVTQAGYNVIINLSDTSYLFEVDNTQADTTAATISNSITGHTKTYKIKISAYQLAVDMAAAITNNAYLLNLWQGIFGTASGLGNLTVDGGCIFQSTSTCNYNFTLNNIPGSGTFALLSSIKVKGVVKDLSYNFNLGNISGLQDYLNSKGIGTFLVTVPNPNAGNDIYVNSNANVNELDALTFSISGSNAVADLAKDCTGYVPISANEVVQNIIKYICNLDDDQIQTSQDYTLTYLDSVGQLQTITVDRGSSVSDLIQALLDTNNTSFQAIHGGDSGGGATDCDSLKAIFKPSAVQPTSTDLLFGTKGDCAGVSYLDAFNYMLKTALTNATTKELFCDLVASCNAGLTCPEFDYIEPFVTLYNTTCSEIIGIEYSIS